MRKWPTASPQYPTGDINNVPQVQRRPPAFRPNRRPYGPFRRGQPGQRIVRGRRLNVWTTQVIHETIPNV